MGILDFDIKQAAAIGIIGGADGPTAIFVAGKLAPELLGAIAIAAYSYMALVPIIQPPIMRALTTEQERKIEMVQLREVSRLEKIVFPLLLLLLVALLLPSAAPLLGMFCFGNLMRECGVVDRLTDTTQNALINIVTIFLGLGVGSKLSSEAFLNIETLGILFWEWCVRDRNCQWGFNGKAHERSQFYANQSVDRSGRSLCSAYGIKSGE